ncbi:MAG: alpha-glycosidase [Lachnospiraceae bacterium]|nr:alpha-glycosidase [Lachnospiraceae bacterium]
MNKYATLHIMDSAYCFPVTEHDIVIRLRTAHDDMDKVWLIYESKYVFGESQKRTEMNLTFSGEVFDYYSVRLHLEDTRLAYVFYLYDGKSYRFFSEDGFSEDYDYTKGFYNFFQYPYINRADLLDSVDWMKRAVFYQIFVDRFCIGDTGKDMQYVNMKWGDAPTPKSFAGGDLKGITKKLDYIRELGVNAIYLTPVFSSKSNHKYDIRDYMQIDEHFGTKEDFRELVDCAHQRGMRVVLDAVFNHCSEEISQFQDVCRRGKQSEYFDWFIISGEKPEKDPCNYETFAACDYMPKLNTSNPEVREFLLNIACYYIREFDIDGWRLDVSDEVSHDFWRAFRKAVKNVKADAVIIGENWHDASNYLRGDQYDSIMNYAFTKCCLDFFATETMNARQAAGKLNDILARNSDTVNHMMLNLLDSHDTHRFFSEVGEDEKKFKAALCLLYLFPGAPCIFYGTEIKITGGYDPDCRKCMDWERTEKEKDSEVFWLLKTLSHVRRSYDLANGRVCISSDKDGRVLLYENDAPEGKIRLLINHSPGAVVDNGVTLEAGESFLYVEGGERIC